MSTNDIEIQLREYSNDLLLKIKQLEDKLERKCFEN